MFSVSQRLRFLLVEIKGESCADIGCDHGKLIVSALKENRIERGYAIDISAQSLQKTERISREEGVSSRLRLLCSDGGKELPEKVSVAVIAGMGATETVHILSEKDFAEKYVLSPHQDAHILRKYLAENDYRVLYDYIIFDKKYYPIIVAEKGQNTYLSDEYYFGKNFPNRQDFHNYVKIRYDKLSNIVGKLGKNANKDTLDEWEECQKWYKEK